MFKNNRNKYIFLIVFAFFNCYMLFNLSAIYKLDGNLKREIPSIMIGGQTAGDYALASMLESKDIAEAYNPAKQYKFLEKKLGLKGVTFSNSNPIRSFLMVPFLEKDFVTVFNLLCFVSIFLFLNATYCFFSWKACILLCLSLPTLSIAFSQGIFELLLASIFLFLIADYPKNIHLKSLLGGILSASVVLFLSYLLITLFKKKYKVLIHTLIVFLFLLLMIVCRYGYESIIYWGKTSAKLLKTTPFLFESFFSYSLRSSLSSYSVFLSIAFTIGVFFLVRKSMMKEEKTNQCMKICEVLLVVLMLNPFLTSADFVYLGIVAIIFIYDSEERGWLYTDKILICIYFASIFVDGLFAKSFSMQYLLLMFFTRNCIERMK